MKGMGLRKQEYGKRRDEEETEKNRIKMGETEGGER